MTRTPRTAGTRRTAGSAHLGGPGRSARTRALVLTGAAVVLVAGLSACGASAGDDDDPDRRSFDLSGSTLTVDSDDSALEIVAADGHPSGEVRVTRWFRGTVALGKEPEVTWSMDGDRLVLREKCSGVVADCSTKHRIEVPRGVAVKVEEKDGSVRARGFRDALSIRTTDGSVHVTDSTGPLELRTGDGSVRAEVASRTVRARTGDGSVRLQLEAVPDRVEARSGDGSLTVDLPRAAYRVTTGTGDGAEEVSVPRDDSSPHVVTARTGDGKLTVRTAN
ncbi:lipoprotein [Streptomyces griseomycini]|uniref:DUF4097 family beta strand repeat-containing protein n=1 Tax=Streptomyces griseomycini TaxID=66895 RepID=UPI0018747F6B|nr:DUF4097 family beta strand repeat-containing protein [Streptomyces griseomycini]GGP85170.1 lipoprotein [Streptomyces griseomycini]